MSFSFESTRVQQPFNQPTTTAAGNTYKFAHRRQNLDGQHSLWRVGPDTELPATFTPEPYGDDYLKDEFLMSDDNGVTWRIVTAAANHQGALTVSAFDSAWAVTVNADNQQSYLPPTSLGTFSATESPSRTFYLVNFSNSLATLGFNVIDTVTELVASQYSGQVQLELEGVYFQVGNGNPNTSFNKTLIWQTPPQSLNAFALSLPTNAFCKLTLTLINFPQGGIQSSSVDFGLEFTANPSQFPIGLDHVWLQGSRLVDNQAGFNADLVSSSVANTINIAPFAVNILGSAYYQATNLSFIRTPSGTVNYRLQATSELNTQIVESTEALPANSVSLVTFDFDGTTITNITNIAPIRTSNYGHLSDATIARGRFISVNSSGEPTLATSATEVIGVSLFTDSGYFTPSGLVWLETSAAISVGSFLQPNAQGKAASSASGPAVALSSSTGADQFILAQLGASGSSSGGGGGSTTLASLTDTDLTTSPPTDGQALVYNSTNSNWEPGTITAGSGASGAGGAYIPVETITTSGSQASVSLDVSSGVQNYFLVSNWKGSATTYMRLIANGDTTPANYQSNAIFSGSSFLGDVQNESRISYSETGNSRSNLSFTWISLDPISNNIQWRTIGHYISGSANINQMDIQATHLAGTDTAINSLELTLQSGNFNNNSEFRLYALKDTNNDPAAKTLITEQTSTAYTLTLTDAGLNKLLELNNASAITLTVPLDSTTNFPVGSTISFVQQGAGQVTVAPETVGVTINSANGHLLTRAQYSSATLIKRATNEWTLIGDITT